MSAKSGSQARDKKRRPRKKNRPLRPKTGAKTIREEQQAQEEPASSSPDLETQQLSMAELEAGAPEKFRGIRVQKLLADRGYGSRRKMEAWIREGEITVNGQDAQIGQRVTRQDIIKIKGHPLREKPQLSKGRVLMYNKPEGEICTMNDPRRRPTVYRNLPRIRGARWVAVGRLDINTSGLLLFTTNGELANQLMHPSSGIEREYRCRIFGDIGKQTVQQLLDGIKIENHLMRFNRVVVFDTQGEQRNKWVHVTLEEGRNREVRKLWEAVGCQVSRLTRVRYGSLTLPRNLRQGQHRELTSKEIRKLTEQN